MDLLKIGGVRRLLCSRWFPMVPQLIMLAAFGALIAGGIGVTTGDPGFAKWLRNTNLSNLVVWSYWWPVIIVVAVVLGRFWCMVCPVELVAYFASQIGLRRKVPSFFKSGWAITIFYTLILIVGVHTLAIHRIPQRMAYYMLMLLLVAVAVSLVFRKRAFCSYVCPVGHQLGLYALISPFEWRACDTSVCKSCKTKDCFVRTNHYRLFGRSCTSDLHPATIKNNQDCLLCTQCLKACPYQNLRLSTRWPFADFFGRVSLRPAQTGFVLLLSGFVVYEILSEWAVSKAVLTWIPGRVIDALAITGPAAGLVSAIIMFIVFPAILFLAAAAAARAMSDRDTTAAAVGTYALLLIPTMAGAHLIKSMLKMVSRIPYWSHACSDPKGIMTAQSIVDETLILDPSVPDAHYPVVSYAAAAVLLGALIATLVIFRRSEALKKLSPGTRVVLLPCVLLYWGIFGFTILRWRF